MNQEILQTLTEIVKAVGVEESNNIKKDVEDTVKQISNITGIPENIVEMIIQNGLLKLEEIVSPQNSSENQQEENESLESELSIEDLFDPVKPINDYRKVVKILESYSDRFKIIRYFEGKSEDSEYKTEKIKLKEEKYTYEIIVEVEKYIDEIEYSSEVAVEKNYYSILDTERKENCSKIIRITISREER